MIGGLLLVKNQIIKKDDIIYRILDVKNNKYLLVNCKKLRMPFWIDNKEVIDYEVIEESDFLKLLNIDICNYDDLDNVDKKITNDRFGSISLLINSVGDFHKRNELLKLCSNSYGVSIETIRMNLKKCQMMKLISNGHLISIIIMV